MSGDIEAGTGGIILVGLKGEINLQKGIIIAARHVHCSEEKAEKFNLHHGQTFVADKADLSLFPGYAKIALYSCVSDGGVLFFFEGKFPDSSRRADLSAQVALFFTPADSGCEHRGEQAFES